MQATAFISALLFILVGLWLLMCSTYGFTKLFSLALLGNLDTPDTGARVFVAVGFAFGAGVAFGLAALTLKLTQ